MCVCVLGGGGGGVVYAVLSLSHVKADTVVKHIITQKSLPYLYSVTSILSN